MGEICMETIMLSKYQGLGNDYLVLDPNRNQMQLVGKKIELLCKRGFGIGADGILYGPIFKEGKIYVRIFNPDGGETRISGNGVGIFAKYLKDQEYVRDKKFFIYTESGPLEVESLNERATEFKIHMGKAAFVSREIPVSGAIREVVNEPFTFDNSEYRATCLSVGNPHCIIFMDLISPEKVRALGPYVENAAEFPERMNLQICKVIDPMNLEIEIYERGAGYTQASGTGSCAAAAAAYRLGLTRNLMNVHQPGGSIEIEIKEDGSIYMTGSVGFITEINIAESFFA